MSDANLGARAKAVCEARGHGGLWPSPENCIVCALAKENAELKKRLFGHHANSCVCSVCEDVQKMYPVERILTGSDAKGNE